MLDMYLIIVYFFLANRLGVVYLKFTKECYFFVNLQKKKKKKKKKKEVLA